MRLAAFLALFLIAAAGSAGGEPLPAIDPPLPPLDAPPYPGTAPQAPPAFPGAADAAKRRSPADVRAYAPTAGVAQPAALPKGRVEPARPVHGHACFGQSEARDKILQRRLIDPVRAMRAGSAEGETLRTRLCHWRGDDFVYDIYVLRRDGHVVRLYMNAQTGDALSAADIAEHR